MSRQNAHPLLFYYFIDIPEKKKIHHYSRKISTYHQLFQKLTNKNTIINLHDLLLKKFVYKIFILKLYLLHLEINLFVVEITTISINCGTPDLIRLENEIIKDNY